VEERNPTLNLGEYIVFKYRQPSFNFAPNIVSLNKDLMEVGQTKVEIVLLARCLTCRGSGILTNSYESMLYLVSLYIVITVRIITMLNTRKYLLYDIFLM